VSPRVMPTRCDGAAARFAGAQALREAARALRRRPVRTAADNITVASWLYTRASVLTREARTMLAADGRATDARTGER
jgi:hypothetical protein